MAGETVLATGLVERVGEPEGQIKCVIRPGTDGALVVKKDEVIGDHKKGMHLAVEVLTDPQQGVISGPADIAAVGHRVVHGGESFRQPTLVDDAVVVEVLEAATNAALSEFLATL